MATYYWHDHYGRRWTVCPCLQKWLPAYEQELLRRGLIFECIDLYQTIGNASASAKTHSSGGCADLKQRTTEQLRVARNMGAAAWKRDADPNDGQPDMSPEHTHLSLKGCTHAHSSAKAQVVSCENRHNGLQGNGPDDGPREGIKWPLRTWEQGIAWAKAQAAAEEPPVTTRYPADVFGKNWKLTIPFDGPDADSGADEIRQPRLATYAGPSCRVASSDPSSAIFTVNHGAPTTSGSKNPRSELREMRPGGLDEITWDGRRGKHRMEVDLAVNHLTVVRPHVVVAQIHDADDDLTVLRCEGVKGTNRIKVWITRGDVSHAFYVGEIKLTQRFKFAFDVADGKVRFDFNGRRLPYTVTATAGSYFKTGAYLQSNYSTAPSESKNAYAQVRMFTKPTVTHA
jgi:hypothetical protein